MSDSTNDSDSTTQLPDILGSVYVAELPTIPITSLPAEDPIDRTCVLCYMPYGSSNNDPVVMLPCHHHFDKSCLLEWLSEEKAGENTCPTCRRTLFEFDEGPFPLYDSEDHELYDELRQQGAPLPQRDPLRNGLELSIDEEKALFQELHGRYRFLRMLEEELRVGGLSIEDDPFGDAWVELVGPDMYNPNYGELDEVGDRLGWTVLTGDSEFRLRNISRTLRIPRVWILTAEDLEELWDWR